MDNIQQYDQLVHRLRAFFREQKGFVEVPTQSRRSILAACEQPETVTTYSIQGTKWPLPQTGQMWLEYELLRNPSLPGVFCVTTSYRDEPTIVPGRHQRVFPMFEFESKGGMNALRALEQELLQFLGFSSPKSFQYEALCQRYGVPLLDAEHEATMQEEFGNVLLLEHFPQRSSPFFNMKRNVEGTYNKIDVILCGMETIGSAERSTDIAQMREDFMTISDGGYAQKLFELFGQERVMNELDEFLSLPMIPRFGGGIGLTRLARAMTLEKLWTADTSWSSLPRTMWVAGSMHAANL